MKSAQTGPPGLLQAFGGEAGGEWEWLKTAADRFTGQELVAQKQAASDRFEALEGMTPQAFDVTSRLKNGASIADRDLELRNRLCGEAQEAWRAYCGARDRAQLDLRAKLAFGQLLALGRDRTRRAEEALIPVQVWAFLKFCFEEGDVARSEDDKDPMVYYFVRIAAVGQEVPIGPAPIEGAAAEPPTAERPAQQLEPERPKNRGGRPPKWDWAAFDREMMRLANTPDGLPERDSLTVHMLEWCMREWGDTPADSGVRARIAERYPE
jgi:hypothetical protein